MRRSRDRGTDVSAPSSSPSSLSLSPPYETQQDEATVSASTSSIPTSPSSSSSVEWGNHKRRRRRLNVSQIKRYTLAEVKEIALRNVVISQLQNYAGPSDTWSPFADPYTLLIDVRSQQQRQQQQKHQRHDRAEKEKQDEDEVADDADDRKDTMDTDTMTTTDNNKMMIPSAVSIPLGNMLHYWLYRSKYIERGALEGAWLNRAMNPAFRAKWIQDNNNEDEDEASINGDYDDDDDGGVESRRRATTIGGIVDETTGHARQHNNSKWKEQQMNRYEYDFTYQAINNNNRSSRQLINGHSVRGFENNDDEDDEVLFQHYRDHFINTFIVKSSSSPRQNLSHSSEETTTGADETLVSNDNGLSMPSTSSSASPLPSSSSSHEGLPRRHQSQKHHHNAANTKNKVFDFEAEDRYQYYLHQLWFNTQISISEELKSNGKTQPQMVQQKMSSRKNTVIDRNDRNNAATGDVVVPLMDRQQRMSNGDNNSETRDGVFDGGQNLDVDDMDVDVDGDKNEEDRNGMWWRNLPPRSDLRHELIFYGSGGSIGTAAAGSGDHIVGRKSDGNSGEHSDDERLSLLYADTADPEAMRALHIAHFFYGYPLDRLGYIAHSNKETVDKHGGHEGGFKLYCQHPIDDGDVDLFADGWTPTERQGLLRQLHLNRRRWWFKDEERGEEGSGNRMKGKTEKTATKTRRRENGKEHEEEDHNVVLTRMSQDRRRILAGRDSRYYITRNADDDNGDGDDDGSGDAADDFLSPDLLDEALKDVDETVLLDNLFDLLNENDNGNDDFIVNDEDHGAASHTREQSLTNTMDPTSKQQKSTKKKNSEWFTNLELGGLSNKKAENRIYFTHDMINLDLDGGASKKKKKKVDQTSVTSQLEKKAAESVLDDDGPGRSGDDDDDGINKGDNSAGVAVDDYVDHGMLSHAIERALGLHQQQLVSSTSTTATTSTDENDLLDGHAQRPGRNNDLLGGEEAASAVERRKNRYQHSSQPPPNPQHHHHPENEPATETSPKHENNAWLTSEHNPFSWGDGTLRVYLHFDDDESAIDEYFMKRRQKKMTKKREKTSKKKEDGSGNPPHQGDHHHDDGRTGIYDDAGIGDEEDDDDVATLDFSSLFADSADEQTSDVVEKGRREGREEDVEAETKGDLAAQQNSFFFSRSTFAAVLEGHTQQHTHSIVQHSPLRPSEIRGRRSATANRGGVGVVADDADHRCRITRTSIASRISSSAASTVMLPPLMLFLFLFLFPSSVLIFSAIRLKNTSSGRAKKVRPVGGAR